MQEEGLPGVKEFEIRPEHLGHRKYEVGDTVSFYTDQEAEPGDAVVAITIQTIIRHDMGKERIGACEQPIIRILVKRTAEEVVLRSTYNTDTLECLPADRVKAVYPIRGVSFA